MSNSERVSIFIDGNNFYFGLKKVYRDSKSLMNFDFGKLCNFLADNREIIGIFYYNAPLDISEDLEKYKSQQKFFDKIKRIPKFNLILCKLFKRNIKGTNQYYYVLKEDDIHMAVDIVKGAFKNNYDTAIIVSGDGDFLPAVKAVQEENKKVENIYFKKTASFNLKRNCNKSFMLKRDILDKLFETKNDTPNPKPQ